MQDSENHRPRRRPEIIADDEQTIDTYSPYGEHSLDETLPQNGLILTVITGIVGAIVSVVLPLLITLANASSYREVARLKDNTPLSLAWTVTGLSCLNLFIPIVVCVLAGVILGKLVVRRKLAAYAGGIIGAATYLLPTIFNYIPGFPTQVVSWAPTATATTMGIVLLVVLTIVYGLVGALLALLGSQPVTKNHPSYLAKKAAIDESE